MDNVVGITLSRDEVYQVWSGDVLLGEWAANAVNFIQTSIWTSGKAKEIFQTRAHGSYSVIDNRTNKP